MSTKPLRCLVATTCILIVANSLSATPAFAGSWYDELSLSVPALRLKEGEDIIVFNGAGFGPSWTLKGDKLAVLAMLSNYSDTKVEGNSEPKTENNWVFSVGLSYTFVGLTKFASIGFGYDLLSKLDSTDYDKATSRGFIMISLGTELGTSQQ